ncbi:MAG: hypothetical protein HUU38_07280 [Anaerolineales bacterium]|nr:hypothetical protein [Anaerolineales bacterium]
MVCYFGIALIMQIFLRISLRRMESAKIGWIMVVFTVIQAFGCSVWLYTSDFGDLISLILAFAVFALLLLAVNGVVSWLLDQFMPFQSTNSER